MKTPKFHCTELRGCLTVLGIISLTSLSVNAQTYSNSNGNSNPRRTTAAATASTREEPGFLDRLFSRPTRRETTQTRSQPQRLQQQQYAAARTNTQYYTPPTSTYIPTQPVTPGMKLTNRTSPARSTVIYQNTPAQSGVVTSNYTSSYTTNSNTRYLQPGESATITADGTVFRSQDGQALTTTPPAETAVVTPPPRDLMPVTEPKPAAPPKALLDRESLPVAKWAPTFGRVVSPYPPHHELDVTGLPPGSLARDPLSKLIFRLP